MNRVVTISVTAPAEVALKKLTRANIPVHRLKKEGFKLSFGVEEEYLKKVFAIFAHPCYNVSVRRKSIKMRFADFARRRFALIAGAAMFVAVAIASSHTVLRIKITGSGSYLAPQVSAIAGECGAREWSACPRLDVPLLKSRVLSLPSVNFCSVQRAGAYLIIDVQTDREHSVKSDYAPLKCDVNGTLLRIVAVCGTAERTVGEAVSKGDVLISPYRVGVEGERSDCLAVGFAEVSVTSSLSLFYPCESEENAEDALKAPSLYSDKVLEKSYTVSPCEGGVKYEVGFTYLKTFAINME